jgi:Ca-activated chloride channel family protein
MQALRCLAVASAVLAGLSATAAPQQRTFRSATDTVSVYATVNDTRGRLVPDLARDDFEIFDEGKPVEITVFSKDPQPITVAVMLDMSGSMVSRFLLARNGMLRFIDALGPADRMRIGTFGEEIALSPWLTGDKRLLKRILEEELWPGGETPLWNAIDAGMWSLSGEPGRRVLLVVTDGADSGGLPGRNADFGAVVTHATTDSFMVYAIGIDGTGVGRELISLTTGSGGGRYDLPRSADLDAAFTEIADELRHQYQLGFTPAALDGKPHTLQVNVKRPGMTARARKTYVATRTP